MSAPNKPLEGSTQDSANMPPSEQNKEWLHQTLDAGKLKLPPSADPLPQVASSQARLIALMDNSPGRTFPLDHELIIGRDPKCSVWTPQLDVSRRHARIYVDDTNAYIVEDLDSKNGTLVNGVTVSRKTLNFGDRIQIGTSAHFLFSQSDQLHEQLLQSQKMEAMGRLAASVVHDFGNLLTSVLGHVGLIEDSEAVVADKDVLASVHAVKSAAQTGAALIQQLLRFAKSGESKPVPVSISEVVEEAIRIVHSSLRSHIHVHLDLGPDLYAVGDKSQLHQLILNLVTNARDAMREGGTLTITSRHARLEHAKLTTLPALPSGAYTVLTVEDTGHGMNSDTQQRIFEPFFTTKDPDRGTGLGLAAVYGIVRSHGGGIEVISTPGSGTTFQVFLPLPTAKPGAR